MFFRSLVGGPISGSPAAEDGCQRLHPAAAPGPRHIQPGLAPQRSGTLDKFVALCEDRLDVEQADDCDCDLTRAHIGLLKQADISQISTSLWVPYDLVVNIYKHVSNIFS